MSILETLLKDPAVLKGAMSAVGFDPAQLVGSINRFAQAVSNVSDKIDPPTVAAPTAAVPLALPEEGFVLDHTGAKVALKDIVAAVQLNGPAAPATPAAPPPPVVPKGECINCLLAHPITRLPTPAICGACEKDPARPKFVQRP